MKAIICGGRDFKDWQFVARTLEAIHARTPFERIATGGAVGADCLAHFWAEERGIERVTYFAEWHLHGKAAGPLRNQKMLDEERPDLVIAFPGGAGTADMTGRAEAAGVRVHRVSRG